MPVTDDIVAAYRAYLSGDTEQWHRRIDALDLNNAPATSRANSAYLTALFMDAVERRFNANTTRDEIIDFVADLRSRDDQIAEKLDPDATERMVAMVFDDDVATDDIPRHQTIGIRMGVLAVIIREGGLDSAELEEFLEKSRAFANEILG